MGYDAVELSLIVWAGLVTQPNYENPAMQQQTSGDWGCPLASVAVLFAFG